MCQSWSSGPMMLIITIWQIPIMIILLACWFIVLLILMWSVLGRDPPSIRVSRKSFQWFLCNPADKPTNQQTDTGGNTTSLAKVITSLKIIKPFSIVRFFKMWTTFIIKLLVCDTTNYTMRKIYSQFSHGCLHRSQQVAHRFINHCNCTTWPT